MKWEQHMQRLGGRRRASLAASVSCICASPTQRCAPVALLKFEHLSHCLVPSFFFFNNRLCFLE